MGPASQIHSPHFHIGAHVIFFRSFKVCLDAKERVGCEKQREATASIPGKTAAFLPECAVEDLPLPELQTRFLRLL